jgi:hypothetical protein
MIIPKRTKTEILFLNNNSLPANLSYQREALFCYTFAGLDSTGNILNG